MGQHAGFGAVATVSEELANSIAWAYMRGTGPIFFPAPDSVTIGNTVVRFAGIFEMQRIRIHFQPNAGDLLKIDFAFRCKLRAQVLNPGGLSLFRAYDVELRGTVVAKPIIQIQNQQIFLGINTASVVFAPLVAVTLSGPPLPPAVQQALQSPVVAALATAFVQSRPNVLISPPSLKTVIEKTVPGEFKETGISIFNWFTVRLEASTIVFKVLAGALSLAVDFRNRTAGNVAQLGSVLGVDDVWIDVVTPADVEQQRPPYITKGRPRAGGNFGILFNMAVLSGIVDSVSAQTAHTRVSENAELRSLSLGYSTFTKPLYPGVRDGLRLGFHATVHPSDLNVQGAVYLQPIVEIYEGPTAFLRAPAWSLRVVHSELDTPWWLDLVVFAIAVLASAALPALVPIFLVTAIAITNGVLPALLDDARRLAAKGIEQGLLGIPSETGSAALPGLPGGSWSAKLGHIAVLPEGMHTVLDVSAWNALGHSKLIAPDSWHAEYRRPMPFSVKLDAAIEKMSSNLTLLWEAFRTDNGALLRSRNRRYLGDDVLFAIDPLATVRGVQIDPQTNGILIGLRDPDLYFLDAVKVRCTASATLGSQVGVVWSDEVVVKVSDNLNRRRNFLEWGPHSVFFANAGTKNEVWSHNRTSKIHRTATGARCMMLRQRASIPHYSDQSRRGPKFRYFDKLPHEWSEVTQHRHFLCDYCFFGGPDKPAPFAQENWL